MEAPVSFDVPGLADAQLVPVLGAISRHRRPTSRALAEAIRVVRTSQSSVWDWPGELG